jgi:hypothetical protein
VTQTKLTVERVMALSPCDDWPEERVREALWPLPTSDEEVFDVLIRVYPADARWLLSELMTPNNAAAWAGECASRCADYSAAAASRCADYSAAAASYAISGSYAARIRFNARLAATAAYAAAESGYAEVAEHHSALRHAIELIEPLENK